jgi:hypothetical protein
MKIIPPNNYSKNQWMLLISSIILQALVQALHFIIEFTVIRNTGVPTYFVSFHYIGLVFGELLCIFFLNRVKNQFNVYLSAVCTLSFFYISLILINQPWYVPIGLFGIGFFFGTIINSSIELIFFSLENPKDAGRIYGSGYFQISLMLLFITLIDSLANYLVYSLILIIFFLLTIILALGGKKATVSYEQKPRNLKQYFKNKDNIPLFIFMFFWGFFWTSTYYATYLILELNGLLPSFHIFLIFFFLSTTIASIPCGILMDTLGRRYTIIIGCLIQSLAFLILSFLTQVELILLYIFPIVLGIGFSLSITAGLLVLSELPKGDHSRNVRSVAHSFVSFGLIFGVLIIEAAKSFILTNPSNLTLIFLFVFICATIVIFRIRETLPSRALEELIRPTEKINEDDLKLYKEKKICLVCKGKVLGFNSFICKCDALYCQKCARSLSTMENACWVCDAPFDESRPTKLAKEEEEILIKPDISKKK